MSKSTGPRRRGKAPKYRKPRPDFPLTPHPSGRWCKRVKGTLHYFGKIDGDEKGEAALSKWLDERDDIRAGRKPRSRQGELTVLELCNQFMQFKQGLLDAGELAPRTFERYHSACNFMLSHFGRGRSVADLRPDDFRQLRAAMSKRWGPVAVGNEVQMIRSVFKFGYEAELLDKPVRFGPGFAKPSAKTLRKTRAAHGVRMFTPVQARALLDHATTNMRAMLLLGLNAGLGNTDLAELPISAVDLEGGWLNYPRAKTAIPRRVPLWQETQDAIRDALNERCEPAEPASAELLFVGRRGQDYTGNSKGYRVTQEFNRVAKWAGVEGRSFYDCRRTIQTIGEGAHDLAAVQSIMGHAAGNFDMSAVYRQTVDDERLRAVTDHVHQWLYGDDGNERGDRNEGERPSLRIVG